MANNTSRGITYPTSGDNISPLETVFATLASTTNTALGNLDAADIATGTLGITRGGTGAATAAAALTSLGALGITDYSAAGKNKLLNGDFGIWQRASTATSSTATGYFADRWRYSLVGGTSKVFSYSRQDFATNAALSTGAEHKYFAQISVTTAGSGYTAETFEQPIEDVRTLAGKVVTFSFWAKVSAGSISVTPRFTQYFGTGGTPSASVVTNLSAVSVTTTWTRFTGTVTLPAMNTGTAPTLGTNNDHALIVALALPNNSTYTVQLWGMQLEEGSNASRFSLNGASKQAELASCQRYYWRLVNDSVNGSTLICNGTLANTTTFWGAIQYPVKMRSAPQGNTSATAFIVRGSTDLTASSIGAAETGTTTARILATTATGTAGQGAFLRFNSAINTGWIDFTSEL